MTTPDQHAHLERPEYDPWVLVNLLRFNHRVLSEDGGSASGTDIYEQFQERCRPVLERFGATVLWAGDARFAVAGLSRSTPPEGQPQWDRVVLVRYPTAAAYRAFIGDPEFRQALSIKDAAVAETEILVCAPDGQFEPSAKLADGATGV